MSSENTNTEEDEFFGDLFNENKSQEEVSSGEKHDAQDSIKDAGVAAPDEPNESNYSPNNPSCDSPDPSDSLPQLTGVLDSYPKAYANLTRSIQRQYERLPYVDFDAVYNEVEKLSIKSTPTPTLQTLNDELQRIQGAKDRLVEIYVNVIKCHNTKKRCTDVLQDAWGKYSEEKNAEKRRGDSIMCVNEFIVDLIQIETLMKYCSQIMKNLDSIQDTTSRRVTIMQSIMKVDFFSRNAMPDQDYRQSVADYHNPLDNTELDKELLVDNEDDGPLKAQEGHF